MESVEIAKEVFDIEIEQLKLLRDKLDNSFEQVVNRILAAKGRVVISGIGKSGIIGKKIAASLASTGTNSFFLHSAEALHGDLGMVCEEDVVIAISNSGASQEVTDMIPSLKRIGCTIIAMTGNMDSTLAKEAEYVLDIGVGKEACPLGLAPTSSTTATLVLGDALTVALIKKRNFKPEKFALYHPGGALGRRLLTQVKDIMHNEVPKVYKDSNLREVVDEIIRKKLAMTMVFNENNEVVGIITDGDIRRTVFDSYENIKQIKAKDIMNKTFKCIQGNEKVNFALEQFETYKVSSLVVCENQDVIGIITIQDVIDFRV